MIFFPVDHRVVKLNSTQPVGQALSVDTAIYASGDALHTGYLTLPVTTDGGRVVYLTKVTTVDKSAQAIAYRIYLFDQPPLASTITANAAFVLHDTDAFALVAVIDSAAGTSITTDSFKDLVLATPEPIKPYIGKTLYAALVLTAGTPTFAAASDLQVTMYFETH